MSASRRIDRVEPSLFPFLSVLVCMIGAVMFIAAAIAPVSLARASSQVEIYAERSGSWHDRQPIFIECNGDTARSLDGRFVFARQPEEEVTEDRRWSGTPFTEFLSSLRGGRDYPLFIVRPNGREVFSTLRWIIVSRNRSKCGHSVQISVPPAESSYQQLPRSVREKLRWSESDGRLHAFAVLTSADRDAIKRVFSTPEAQGAVDRLFDASQMTAADWIDYGTELVPQGWKISIGRREK